MGLRFRKSVKIMKGVSVNFSKSGASLSLGGRGHSVNIGKRGVRTTLGIPGTGISYSSTSRAKRSTGGRKTVRTVQQSVPFRVQMGLDGKISILDPSTDRPITDESVLRKIRASQSYKDIKEQLEKNRQQRATQIYRNSHAENEKFLKIHRLAAPVDKKEAYIQQRDNLQLKKYHRSVFPKVKPSEEEIRSKLEAEAETAVTTKAFWKSTGLKKQYVEERLHQQYQEAMALWEKERAEFEAEQDEIELEKNEEYREEFDENVDYMNRIIGGDYDTVCDAIDTWLEDCTLPVEINVNYDYFAPKGMLMLDVQLPGMDAISQTEIVKLKTGIKEKQKSQATLKEEYATLCFSLALFLAANIFNLSPGINYIILSGYVLGRNKSGDLVNNYLYSIKLVRRQIEGAALDRLHAIKACMFFENRCNLTSTMQFKPIEPFATVDSNSQTEDNSTEGLAALDRGDYQRATQFFLDQVKTTPTTTSLWNLGWSCYQAAIHGKDDFLEDAIEYLTEAETGHHHMAANSLGLIYDPLKKDSIPESIKSADEAIHHYKKSIGYCDQTTGDYVIAPLNNMALIYYKINNDAFLAACYTKVALGVVPGHETLEKNYERYFSELTNEQQLELSNINRYEDVLHLLGEETEDQPQQDMETAVNTVSEESSGVDQRKTAVSKKDNTGSKDDPYQQLNNLIGMDEIKADVIKLVDFMKMQQARKEMGMKMVPVSLHLVFTGNPGTGKTTVARILAKIYKEIGILSKGQLIEVDRAGLVAGYVGQTALKTQEKIDAAIGGILFIDEAYTLIKEGNDFGQEAIDTLLKAMEDHRENFVVIVAGYPQQMGNFINSNPGLKSRFNKYFQFPDYTSDEMIRIFESMCQEYNYMLDSGAEQKINHHLQEICSSKGKNFANAREVRNIFEKIIGNQATRLMNMDHPSEEDMLTITESDIVNVG